MIDKCEIIQDLIPLVNDGVASDASKKLVFKHCENCTECKSMLHANTLIYNEKTLQKKWQKQLQKLMLGILVIIILFSCSFTETIDQFNNFILLPLVGCLGYYIINKYIYIFYIAIPFIFILLNLLGHEISFVSTIFYTLIYWVLLSCGVIIYLCYAYAFKKEE